MKLNKQKKSNYTNTKINFAHKNVHVEFNFKMVLINYYY